MEARKLSMTEFEEARVDYVEARFER